MMHLAWTLARRELRGGLRGFWVFLLCLYCVALNQLCLYTMRVESESLILEYALSFLLLLP